MSDLIVKAAQLARQSPQAWGEFLGALQTYNKEILDQLVASPPEQLANAQGRAQQCAQFLRTLSNAVSLADKIERRNS